ncbi:solute carrier family 35 member B1 homolog [Diorhabda carinulata]|uniref:solute carrier family 35 member B1 homolog n=1 Tax=Diorhabda carinulata TaxID=1163345 RepID=UPI0025A0B946|nr:solute carrier family 35 member B1 homolog [Diorhabda carinulata]
MHKNRFFLYAAGIFMSYFYFGIVQEKITRGKYPYEVVKEDGTKSTEYEKYTYAVTLVLVQCIMNFLVAKTAATLWHQGEDTTHKFYYASMSITYLLAMICSNMALQWVPYPTQVIGKSAKPIPVMILGVLVGKKSYALRKYIFVFMIVCGIVLFMLKDKVKSQTEESSIGIGELLLVLSLIMDGLIGAIQERIRAESKPTGVQMMEIANAWSVLFLSIIIIISGEYYKFYEFATRFPYVVTNLLMLGITSAVGQLFLYSMVSEFGPLVVSVVTTTRKFFTVLASVILFGNAISIRQWIGAITVFTALFLDAFYSKSAPKKL